jgi:tRNA dimethylallyltransferase
LGPTASGKTRLACALADALNGEIISADSRQVYKQLDIGTGKDLDEYMVNGKAIPYHLISIVDPAEQFYLHQFAAELRKAFDVIRSRNRLPIICGGTGLYLDALRKDFSFTEVKEDEALRKELEPLSKDELLERLTKYPKDLISHVDLNSKKRLIRGIEVAAYFTRHGRASSKTELPYRPFYIGIKTEIAQRKKQISDRLQKRLEGLINETNGLLNNGITHTRLQLFGLEYKFASRCVKGEISREELFIQLQTAIFQFAKRQMTWFRKMEKEGIDIHWIESKDLPIVLERIKQEFTFSA